MGVADTSVKHFHSSMLGAPTLSGTAGALITLLDAVLLANGWPVSTVVTGIVVANNVATVTTQAAHGFAMLGLTGPVITIAGATPSSLNGDWRVASVPNATSFTFVTSGIADVTASGTITAKRTSVGWTKPFSGTNKGVYLPKIGFCQHYYRFLDDSTVPTSANGRWAKLRGYETMSDVDTGTGLFPTVIQSANGMSVIKSEASNTTSRNWWVVADNGLVYLGIACSTTYPNVYAVWVFGDMGSCRTGDAYSSCVIGHTASYDTYSNVGTDNNYATLSNSYTNDTYGHYFARKYTQVGSSNAFGKHGMYSISSALGYSGPAYPNVADNGMYVCRVMAVEQGVIRQPIIPGMFQFLQGCPFVHLDAFDNFPDYPGRTLVNFMAVYSTYYACTNLMDITGPWR